MPKRTVLPRLTDILDAIAVAEQAIEGKTFADFEQDRVLRWAIERAIEIISEATRHIPTEMRSAHDAIPWKNIIGIGNLLRHEYDRLHADIIWDIATRHLPDLKSVVEAMKRELKEDNA